MYCPWCRNKLQIWIPTSHKSQIMSSFGFVLMGGCTPTTSKKQSMTWSINPLPLNVPPSEIRVKIACLIKKWFIHQVLSKAGYFWGGGNLRWGVGWTSHQPELHQETDLIFATTSLESHSLSISVENKKHKPWNKGPTLVVKGIYRGWATTCMGSRGSWWSHISNIKWRFPKIVCFFPPNHPF